MDDIVESRVDISIWHVRYGMRSSCLEGSDAESLVVGKEDTTRLFRLNRVARSTTLNIVRGAGSDCQLSSCYIASKQVGIGPSADGCLYLQEFGDCSERVLNCAGTLVVAGG